MQTYDHQRRHNPDQKHRDARARYWRIRAAVELVKSAAWLAWFITSGGLHLG